MPTFSCPACHDPSDDPIGHAGCTPSRSAIQWEATPAAIAGTVRSTYRSDPVNEIHAGYWSEFQVCWLTDTDRFLVSMRREGGSWSPSTTLVEPERFGPLPMESTRGQSKRARAIIAAFHAA